MNSDRRQLLAAGAAAAVLPLFGAGTAVAAGVGDDVLDGFRRLYTSGDGTPRCWWFSGHVTAAPETLPELPILDVQAVLAAKSRMITPDEMIVDWVEIGCYVDPFTREAPRADWVNAVTGAVAERPLKFASSGGYRLRREAAGLDIIAFSSATQVDVRAKRQDGPQTVMLEYERIGHLGGAETPVVSRFKQSMFAPRKAFDDKAMLSVPGAGSYSRETFTLPPFAGFGTLKGRTLLRGGVIKTAMDETPNADAHARLRKLHPEAFQKGDFAPPWGV